MAEDHLHELELYSPIQVDIIDRDIPLHSVPLQAVSHERKGEYLELILSAFQKLRSQEEARNAFTAPRQEWPEALREKIVSLTRSVGMINGRPHGIYICRSSGEFDSEEVETVKTFCRYQWEQGWGEGYAHCPRQGSGLGLYIHFWKDDGAPLLTREQWEAARDMEKSRATVTEITPETFWMLLAQAKDVCGEEQETTAYWLTERLLEMGPEQALNFHSILHGYMELADQYGLWNAAILMREDGCHSDGFEDFRSWLIAQGRDTYLAALKNPDSLAEFPADTDCRFADLPYVGDMAYDRLTGRMAYNDVDPDEHRKLVAELRKDIVYGAEIGYPHEWSEIAAYLPHLTAQRLTPEELRACICRGYMWNHDDPDIQRARAAAPKKKGRSGNKKGDKSR